MISNTPPDEALAAIHAGVARVIRRVEIYESDGETLWTPPNGLTRSRLVSGSVTLDYSRDERRMLDGLVLDNQDGMLDLGNSEGFWYNKIIKPYRGVRYSATPVAPFYKTYAEWEVQLGEYMIDTIKEDSEISTVSVSGRDYTKKCLLSKFEQSVTFEAGSYVYEIVRSLAANCGIKKMKIPFTNETIGTEINVERGTDRWSIMKQAANSNSYDLYFDNQGYLVMEKYADPAISPSIAHFRPGVGGNMIKYEKSTNDSRLYNHIVVTGDREAVDGGTVLLPYFGEAVNDDPTSPTNVDEIGDRPYFYSSSFFTADSQCAELARTWLRIYSLESYDINVSMLMYPWIDVGKVVDVTEPKGNATIKFLLDTLNMPLGIEPMSGTGKRVLAVA